MNDVIKKIRDRCRIDGDCWIWDQCVMGNGYPQMHHEGRGGQLVRRVAFEATGRKLKNGWTVYAKCEEKLCCNPDHMGQRSRGSMMRQIYATGVRNVAKEVEQRRKVAIERGWAKLDMEKAAAIRRELAAGLSKAEIGRRHGVHPKTVYNIDRNKLWASPPKPASSIFDWMKEHEPA